MSQTSSEQTGERNGAVELTERTRHRLLASRQRRVVLELLAGRAGPVGLGELATAVAEHEASPEAPDPNATERAKTRLHHTHLPKLDDAGVVDYDPDANRVDAWQFSARLL